MAEFSLGGGRQGASGGGGEEGIFPPQGLFLYGSGGGSGSSRSTEAITRGFEIWQQQQQHAVRHHMPPAAPALLSFSSTEGAPPPPLMAAGGGEGVVRGMGSSSSSRGGTISCQDCGNQAKKDCSHLRCRTCCKSRGFDCATHVRSTWVPAARRRERQQQQQHLLVRSAHPPAAAEPSKRPREAILTRLSAAATSSGGEISFPAEVSSPAVFRCLRVSSVDEAAAAEEEFAYQAAISVGGHVFKGILYDHGPDNPSSSPATAAFPAGPSSTSVTLAGVATSAGLVDPSALYPTPLSAFMAGTQFFPQQSHGHHHHQHHPPRQ